MDTVRMLLMLLTACGRLGFGEHANVDGATDTPPDAAAPNFVFVTDPTLTGALGGLVGADAICNDRARAANLPGNYVAWLSTSTTNAIDRIANARGWIRPDGTAVADRPSDLLSSHMLAAISVTADGTQSVESIDSNVLTATDEFGALDGVNCTDWTSATGDYQGGRIYAAGFTWTHGSILLTGCTGNNNRLYCFGIDRVVPLALAPTTGRRAFVTKTLWTPNSGLAGADARCQMEGAALGGTFRALLATSTASAMSRFTDGPTWVRLDGIPLGTLANVRAGNWNVPLNIDADGNYVSFYDSPTSTSWGGAPAPDQVGAATCNDWSLATANAMGGSGQPHFAGTHGFAQSTYNCTFNFRLYCFEQ